MSLDDNFMVKLYRRYDQNFQYSGTQEHGCYYRVDASRGLNHFKIHEC